jgi:hypothetical protein
MPVTLTGTAASTLTSRAAPTILAPASADAPSDVSNNQPDQSLLNLIATLLVKGGLLNVANVWTQPNDFSAATPFKEPVPTWTDLTVNGDWSRVGSPRDPAYWVDPAGLVHLRGDYSSTGTQASGSVITTLPSPLHPTHDWKGSAYVTQTGTGAAQVVPIIIQATSGIMNVGVAMTTINNFLSLDGIVFALN